MSSYQLFLSTVVKMKILNYNLRRRIKLIFLNENALRSTRSYSKTQYKILFFGSDDIALSSLKKINEFRKTDKIIAKLDVVTASTSKTRTIVEKYAEDENLKTLLWPLPNIVHSEYDIGLIVAFGHLITANILQKFPLGMVNVHPSLLPRWRGAAPIIHTLLHGDSITGVTLMKIKADKFDVGEIISQLRVPVSGHELQPQLAARLAAAGAGLLLRCLRELPHSLDRATPQTSEGVTYAKKIDKSISEVRWTEKTAVEVYNLYRAVYGIYQLTTRFRDKQVKLFEAFIDDESVAPTTSPIGMLEYCDRTKSLKILCKDRRYINFKCIRIVGRRKITATDFYNGYIKNVGREQRCCQLC